MQRRARDTLTPTDGETVPAAAPEAPGRAWLRTAAVAGGAAATALAAGGAGGGGGRARGAWARVAAHRRGGRRRRGDRARGGRRGGPAPLSRAPAAGPCAQLGARTAVASVDLLADDVGHPLRGPGGPGARRRCRDR